MIDLNIGDMRLIDDHSAAIYDGEEWLSSDGIVSFTSDGETEAKSAVVHISNPPVPVSGRLICTGVYLNMKGRVVLTQAPVSVMPVAGPTGGAE